MNKNKLKKFMRIRMPQGYDKVIHACIIILLIFGAIMVVSTSVGDSANDHNIVPKTIMKEFFFIVLSYFFMTKMAVNFISCKVNNTSKFNLIMKVSGVVVILLLFATQLFAGANGSKAWIYIPGINVSLQPSEFAKTYWIVLFGMTVNFFNTHEYYKNHKLKFFEYMKMPLIYYGIFVFAIGIQPDSGTLVVLTLIAFGIFLIPYNKAIIKQQQIGKLLFIVGAVLIFFFFFTNPGISLIDTVFGGYKFKRITNAANPFTNIYNTGYNLVYSLYAIANGGISGLGIGASEQKFGYLPEATTDFILPITIEELGLFGLLLITICYGFILYRLLYWAYYATNDGYRVILVGCALYLSIHFALNVGGVSGLIPLTGVPLLFMSAGGSSLLSIMLLLGISQSVIARIRAQRKAINKEGILKAKIRGEYEG